METYGFRILSLIFIYIFVYLLLYFTITIKSYLLNHRNENLFQGQFRQRKSEIVMCSSSPSDLLYDSGLGLVAHGAGATSLLWLKYYVLVRL